MMDFFFALSKILPALLYPFPLFLILLALALFLLPKPTKRAWLKPALWIAWGVFTVVSTPAFASLLAGAWEEPPRKITDLSGPYDAAVVLGGMAWTNAADPDRVQFSDRCERLLEAVALYHDGTISKILITSGSGDVLDSSAKEAPILRKAAISLGVKPGDILIEDQSRNTYENALFSRPVADAAGLERILLVTSAFHMKRSAAIFKKMGYGFTSWPVDTLTGPLTPASFIPHPEALNSTQTLLKEMTGYLVYAMMGYL